MRLREPLRKLPQMPTMSSRSMFDVPGKSREIMDVHMNTKQNPAPEQAGAMTRNMLEAEIEKAAQRAPAGIPATMEQAETLFRDVRKRGLARVTGNRSATPPNPHRTSARTNRRTRCRSAITCSW
jgi:hypothetical protein